VPSSQFGRTFRRLSDSVKSEYHLFPDFHIMASRSVRANQFAKQIGEANTTYAQSRSLSGAVLRGADFFATWSLIALGLLAGTEISF